MFDVIKETLIDGLKLLPFLFITFIVIELIEHKVNNKKIISKTGKFGPFFGSILGIVPQCGFSVSATNLYATRIISLGTLISIYLSTSDEMLPILIGEKANINLILKILILKVLIGMLCGFIIDLIFRKRENSSINHLCEKEHCHCEQSLFISSLKHTLNIFAFIIIISFIINVSFEYIGDDFISKIFMKNTLLSPFICSLFGLIPNCVSSVALTEFYLNSTINFGSLMAGLLTGSGVALMVLFKTNNNVQENIKIISIIYFIGTISGIIINLVG